MVEAGAGTAVGAGGGGGGGVRGGGGVVSGLARTAGSITAPPTGGGGGGRGASGRRGGGAGGYRPRREQAAAAECVGCIYRKLFKINFISTAPPTPTCTPNPPSEHSGCLLGPGLRYPSDRRQPRVGQGGEPLGERGAGGGQLAKRHGPVPRALAPVRDQEERPVGHLQDGHPAHQGQRSTCLHSNPQPPNHPTPQPPNPPTPHASLHLFLSLTHIQRLKRSSRTWAPRLACVCSFATFRRSSGEFSLPFGTLVAVCCFFTDRPSTRRLRS